MSRFLVRAKACHEKGLFGNFGQSGRLAYPGKKILSERTTGTVQGGFFCPVKPIHPSLSRKVFFGRSSVLSGVIRLISEPPRTEYSGEPEMSRFLVRPKACHEKFRTVRAPGLSRPAAKLNKKVFRPERTVCVQSRKRFFTPEQPLHPGLAQIYSR